MEKNFATPSAKPVTLMVMPTNSKLAFISSHSDRNISNYFWNPLNPPVQHLRRP